MANISLISQPASADNKRRAAERGWSPAESEKLASEIEASLFRGIPRGKSAALITVCHLKTERSPGAAAERKRAPAKHCFFCFFFLKKILNEKKTFCHFLHRRCDGCLKAVCSKLPCGVINLLNGPDVSFLFRENREKQPLPSSISTRGDIGVRRLG